MMMYLINSNFVFFCLSELEDYIDYVSFRSWIEEVDFEWYV